jgi:putative redox protein
MLTHIVNQLSVRWAGEMSFEAHTESGHVVPLDASVANGGQNAAPQPVEMLLVSLAGCAATDVLSILKKKRQPIEGFDVRVRSERTSEFPHVCRTIHIEYVVHGAGVQPEAVERAIELTENKYCPVHAMLRPAVAFSHSYVIR